MLFDKDDSEEYILWILVVWTSFLILWVIPGPTFYNTHTILLIWSWVWIRLCLIHIPHYQMVSFSSWRLMIFQQSWKLHLQNVCTWMQKNQVFQQELLSMEWMQKKCEKTKKKLEQDVVTLKSHIEMNMIEHSQVEQYKWEIEERARQDLIEKLKEVNLFLHLSCAWIHLIVNYVLDLYSLCVTSTSRRAFGLVVFWKEGDTCFSL